MKRDDFTIPLGFASELLVDNFCGGGGTSTGLEAAFGRPVDIAINHDPEALAMHAINHPHTRHLCESVWDVNPIAVTGNQPVGLVWLSPDCKHFSKAKGGTPVAKHIRGLAWVGMRWVALTKPRVLMLENVEEFKTWGPLLVGADGTARPDPARKGKTFDSFVRQLRAHGYVVDWRELRACDNGAPTIRKRLFLIARRDGLPIIWPEQTHAAPTDRRVMAGKLLPYRTAAECIDFTLHAASIFDRKKPLATNTQRRVAKGLWRHVLASASPFIVNTQEIAQNASHHDRATTNPSHHCESGGIRPAPAGSAAHHARAGTEPAQSQPADSSRCAVVDQRVAGPERSEEEKLTTPYLTEHANASNQRTMAADEPLRTQCAQVKGGHFSLVAPTITPLRGTTEAHLGGHDILAPLSTVAASGTHHALVAGHITKFNTGSIGTALDEPLATITAGGTPKRPSTGITQGLVGAHMVSIGYGERPGQDARTQDVRAPLGTAVAGGVKQGVVAASLASAGPFIVNTANSKTTGRAPNTWTPDEPLRTITSSNGFAAVNPAIAPLVVTNTTGHTGAAADGQMPTIATGGHHALVAACLEQANGGFYDGDGRAVDAPASTITSSGSQQRLVTAYAVKYYSNGGQWQGLGEPMHTLPTKGRMGLVQSVQINADSLAPEHHSRARQCAELLHTHLPDHFPEVGEMVLVQHAGTWWVLVDITLRMLKPKELFKAQGFPEGYVIHEIPNPALLFGTDGHQVGHPLQVPRIPLTGTAQVRMCGNSVSPPQAEALVRSNFGHEALIYTRQAA